MHRLTLIVCVFLSLASAAFGAGPHVNFYRPPIYPVAPQFFYFVGQPVRIAALVEAELRSDPEYRRFLDFKERQREFEEFLKSQAGAKPAREAPGGSVDRPSTAAAVVRRCASCHGGTAPEGGLFLDGRHELSASQITAAQRRVLAGEMPPSETLSPEEIGNVLQDLLTLERSQP
jgi:hypothetical protein